MVKNRFYTTEYDAVVVGAGHAGCEAALALARTGIKTVMLTLNLDSIAFMACNPSIGGTAKGHLVREIDALGGEMGVNADKTALQIRMLNVGKGAAAHTLALLDELDIRRAHLLTHSFGGRVGLKLLAAHGERFLKAVFTGCAGIPPKRGISYRAKVFSYRAVRKIAPRYAEKHFGSAEYRTLSPVMRESYKKIVNEDLTPCLKDVRNPVLFVFGQQDTATPLYMGKILSEGVRDGALVTMRGTHFCFSEDPDSFNRIAGEFLR